MPIQNSIPARRTATTLFKPLNQKCFMSSSSPVSKELSEKTLKSLFNKEIIAIRIPNFLDKKVCKIVSKKFLTANIIEEYTNAPGIGRLGISYFETQDSSEVMDLYFKDAHANSTAIRQLFSPYQQPIDTLRAHLDEVWPTGANLRILDEKKMFTGLCRSLENGQGIIPHEDKFERDHPKESTKAAPPANVQIALNVYLQNPKEGGELELYEQSLSTEEYDRLRGDSYGIERSLLPPPSISIKPEEGELVLFNSRNLHSVSPVNGDTRLSISSFISKKENNGPLIIWS